MWRRRLSNHPARAWMSGTCLLLCLALILIPGCKPASRAGPAVDQTNPAATPSEPTVVPSQADEPSVDPPQDDQDVEVAPNDPPPPARNLHLPLPRERHTGDLGDMVKRRAIRALVVINPIGF